MTRQLHFYDSATPTNVPSGVAAAVYINGAFRWSRAQQDRMSRIFSVSVERPSEYALFARCIDIENGAGQIADALPFVQHRRSLGYDDATVYVNRSNWGAVRSEFSTHHEPEPLWWVATLDGTQNVADAWAVQYQGGMHAAFDLSILHGVDNLHAP